LFKNATRRNAMFTRCRHVTDKQECQQNSNKLLYTQHDGKEKFQ